MTDREKIIERIHEAIDVGVCVDLFMDVLELLKEQTHGETFTVIDTKTGKEADTYNIALHEDWAKHLCYCDMEGWAIEDDGTLLLVDECGRFEYADRERFKVKWDA
jgi:hypothetical protein